MLGVQKPFTINTLFATSPFSYTTPYEVVRKVDTIQGPGAEGKMKLVQGAGAGGGRAKTEAEPRQEEELEWGG